MNSETEEGEISSAENTDNWDSFVDQADDEQFAAFLKRHQERIRRLTSDGQNEKSRQEEGNLAGEANHLAINIERMSMRGKTG